MKTTNPLNKKPPCWFRIRRRRPITDEFMRLNCACRDQPAFFFSEDLTEQAVAKKLCATCPQLHPCTMWAIYGDFDHGDDAFGIIAGMDPEWRRRVRDGKEDYWDWSTKFNYSERAYKAASRMRDRQQLRKRDLRLTELPLCPGCGSNHRVVRQGRDKETNRQQYQCNACGPYFLGEEL